jgi:hypothetical protein
MWSASEMVASAGGRSMETGRPKLCSSNVSSIPSCDSPASVSLSLARLLAGSRLGILVALAALLLSVQAAVYGRRAPRASRPHP